MDKPRHLPKINYLCLTKTLWHGQDEQPVDASLCGRALPCLLTGDQIDHPQSSGNKLSGAMYLLPMWSQVSWKLSFQWKKILSNKTYFQLKVLYFQAKLLSRTSLPPAFQSSKETFKYLLAIFSAFTPNHLLLIFHWELDGWSWRHPFWKYPFTPTRCPFTQIYQAKKKKIIALCLGRCDLVE